jgi:ATP-dependent helicase/nuclease subunit A
VLSDPEWAEVFGTQALAEVPIAATVGDQVVAGTIDRLLVERTRIRVVDFKTSRRPPADVSGVPVAIVRQMAAYVLALEVAYPGRRVEAAVLYTGAPRLIALPDSVLRPHKARLAPEQESLAL